VGAGVLAGLRTDVESDCPARRAEAAAWHSVKGWLTALPWVMTGAAIGILLALRAPRLKRRFGLIERLFYLSSIAWFFIVSIELARIAG
jgi:hypothetical protein